MQNNVFEQYFGRVKVILNSLENYIKYIQEDFSRHKITYLPQVEKIDEQIRTEITHQLLTLVPNNEYSIELTELYKSLEIVRDSLSRVATAVQAKINEKILFSDRAAEEIRILFNEMMILVKNLRDFLVTGNQVIGKWLEEKQEDFEATCRRYATEHEERLIQGICMPRSSTIYLIILQNICNISWYLIKVPRLMSKKDKLLEC